jgi:hypothetical protein
MSIATKLALTHQEGELCQLLMIDLKLTGKVMIMEMEVRPGKTARFTLQQLKL